MISKEKLEDLELKEKVIVDMAQWWEKTITEKASQLEKLCNKTFNTPEEEVFMDKLQGEIKELQNRGRIEEKIARDYHNYRKTLLFSNLMSGISNMRLD